MSAADFETMSLQEVRENLDYLVKRVIQGKRRVEIVDASGERCVLVSKTDLDCLEKALTILSDTAEFKDICSSMNQLVAATSPSAIMA